MAIFRIFKKFDFQQNISKILMRDEKTHFYFFTSAYRDLYPWFFCGFLTNFQKLNFSLTFLTWASWKMKVFLLTSFFWKFLVFLWRKCNMAIFRISPQNLKIWVSTWIFKNRGLGSATPYMYFSIQLVKIYIGVFFFVIS